MVDLNLMLNKNYTYEMPQPAQVVVDEGEGDQNLGTRSGE